MSYLAEYPYCIGCPVTKYCGTMVSSLKLCNSYSKNNARHKKEAVITPEKIEATIVEPKIIEPTIVNPVTINKK